MFVVRRRTRPGASHGPPPLRRHPRDMHHGRCHPRGGWRREGRAGFLLRIGPRGHVPQCVLHRDGVLP